MLARRRGPVDDVPERKLIGERGVDEQAPATLVLGARDQVSSRVPAGLLADRRRDGTAARQELGPKPALLAFQAQETAELESAVAASTSCARSSIR